MSKAREFRAVPCRAVPNFVHDDVSRSLFLTAAYHDRIAISCNYEKVCP